MLIVDIELNGNEVVKRCPKALFVTADGNVDLNKVRGYFEDLGYIVGAISIR